MISIVHCIASRRLLAAAMIAVACSASPAALMAQDQPAEAAGEEDVPAGFTALVTPQDPPLFDSSEAAVAAFRQALENDDFDGLAALLGLDAAKLRAEDGIIDSYKEIRTNAAARIDVDTADADRVILELGPKLWPFPFPIVKGDDGKWAFDTYAGLEEVVNRRVGENELETIGTMRAIVEAQNEYAGIDRDADGVLEYAQKLVSSAGAADGLYWSPDAGFGESPVGDGIDLDELDDARRGEGYFGYRFKVLTSQGDNIAGGAYDYVINGNMIGGFGVLAWPATYAETGVHSFAVNQHGIVYEVDLGPATADIVKYIDRFNPDAGWTVVSD